LSGAFIGVLADGGAETGTGAAKMEVVNAPEWGTAAAIFARNALAGAEDSDYNERIPVLPVGSRRSLSPADASGTDAQRRDPYGTAAIVAAGLLLLALQWASGAWTAEFDGYPDEAAQFISGRMVWEYLHDLPRENPMQWAGEYYLHYPKVAIGHWPPGYAIVEGLWSLAFGSSRASAMALQWLIGSAAIAGLYQLARRRFSVPATLTILLAAIATPVFQEGLSLVMADLACLLASVLFMHAMMRLIERPRAGSVLLVVISLFGAAMIKGTAVCLFPVPLVVLLACRKRISLQAGWTIAGGLGILAICGAWYAFGTNVAYWGGLTMSMPWPIGMVGNLTGWGCVGIAVLGLRREPLSILAASMVACAAGVSFFLRAMNEPRHWIQVLPAILILDAYAVTSIPRRYIAFLLIPAVVLFPYAYYRETRGDYVDLIRQLRLPARMLISGSSGDEGACIAETAIAERYPGSFVVRATKALASSGWNLENYRLTAATTAQVARRLDELAIDTAVVALAAKPQRPDETLLITLLKGSSSWRLCASSGRVEAYCRTKPPAVPRKPLVLDVGGLHLEERLGNGR
jgi:hypothetical protein